MRILSTGCFDTEKTPKRSTNADNLCKFDKKGEIELVGAFKAVPMWRG